jgi:peptidoglycan/xylan/chitin deacetylase (PgdA/CDA1 family)
VAGAAAITFVVVALAVILVAYGAVLPSTAALPTASIPAPSEGVASEAPSPSVLAPVPFPSFPPFPSPIPSFPPLAEGTVPILYLHRVVAPPPGFATWSADKKREFLAYDVIPAAFAAQLDWLIANGYTTILPRDLTAHWDNGTPLPPRPVIITLDDGSPSWTRTVLPMLQTRHMVAEFYLTLDAIASHSITWNQVRELARAGMGIGAHDVHHVELAMRGDDLPPASLETMWYEVHEARVVIGGKIGTPPDSMAYVGGGFNADLIALVRKAGYTTARSIIRGIGQSSSTRFTLRVIAIRPREDVVDVVTGEMVPGLPTFASEVSGTATPG